MMAGHERRDPPEARAASAELGAWGPDDEIGTLNYITPDAIAAAARLATTGKVFALGIPLQREGPQSGTRQRFNPIHAMFRDGGDQPRTPAEVAALQGYRGSDDWIVMPLKSVTQWDSLAHIFYEGKMWNGYDATLVTSSGAAKNSIDKTTDKIVGRGVLLDVARHKGVRALEPGYAITVADLEATAAAQRVEVGRGDILLVRTGHLSRYLDRKDWRHFDLDDFPGGSGIPSRRSPTWGSRWARSSTCRAAAAGHAGRRHPDQSLRDQVTPES
jgi:Putative cyclase